MNILQQEDIIKGLPDDALMQEAQAPSGQVPQFLVVSEVQRRADMRKRYQEQQQPQGTVAEQIVGEAQQGIASMQQQGGPPPPQAMPPQGMPNLGISMPDSGMPPQQMFGGGIIRLQGGGFLGKQTATGAGSVKSQIDKAVAGGATMADLLTIFKNHPEAISYVQQLYGSGDTRRQLIQDPSVSDMDKAMISNDLAADITADKIGSQFNYFQPPEFLGDVVQAGIGAMEKIPSEQDMVDFYRGILPEPPEKGAAEEAGRQFGEGVRSGVADLFDSEGREALREQRFAENAEISRQGLGFDPTEGSKGFFEYYSDGNRSVVDPSRRGAGAKRGGAEPQGSGGQMSRNSGVERQGSSSIQRQAIDDAIEGLAPDPYVSPYQDQIAALYDQYAGKEPTVPELSKAINLAQDNLNDASSRDFDPAPSPSLDFADLIAESKKMSQANALMQLGAGIAGGDLSKGLSAAGTAATRGAQDARKLAMTQRLTEYNAGRQDLDREQKESQFSRRLELMEKQLQATIEKGERVSRAQLMNMATELAVEAVPQFGGGESTVQDIFNDLLRKYAPFMDVDVMTLPPSEVVKAGQAGPANDPMGLRSQGR